MSKALDWIIFRKGMHLRVINIGITISILAVYLRIKKIENKNKGDGTIMPPVGTSRTMGLLEWVGTSMYFDNNLKFID